jgi:hypothetical protein
MTLTISSLDFVRNDITVLMISSRRDNLSADSSNGWFPKCKAMVVCLLLLMSVSAFASDATPVAASQGNISAASGYAGRDGAAEAKQDIVNGHPKLKAFGLPAPWIHEYAKLLKERLSIEQERIAGCVVNQDLLT